MRNGGARPAQSQKRTANQRSRQFACPTNGSRRLVPECGPALVF